MESKQPPVDATTNDIGTLLGRCGEPMPQVVLQATDGRWVDVADQGQGRTILFIYPMTGRPGTALPDGWATVPGARGCTVEAEGFRDEFDAFARLGVSVLGLSTQSTDDQREVVARLGLPYPLLADTDRRLGGELGLPTFDVDDATYYRRLTMLIMGGRLSHVFHPVEDAVRHAADVLGWLGRGAHPRSPTGPGRADGVADLRR